MDAHSLSLSLEKKVDSKAVAKKVPELKLGPGGGFLQAKVGKLLVIVFSNGRVRITLPGEELENLQKEVAANAIGLGKLLEAIRTGAGSSVDVGKALASGGHDLVEYNEIKDIPYNELRPTFKDNVSAEVLNAVLLGANQILPGFQSERFLAQAGELIGRQAVRDSKPADAKALQNLIAKVVEERALGKMKFEKPEAGVDYLIVVDECPSAGAPVYGKALCTITRGIIRGAFSAFRRAENTAVHEVRCWGLGDADCAFEVRMLSV